LAGIAVGPALAPLALLAVIADLLALRAWRRGHLQIRTPEPWVALWVASLGLYLVAVSPVLAHGYVSPLGENVDFEFYLPLATYLESQPVPAYLVNPDPQGAIARNANPVYEAPFDSDVRALGGYGILMFQALLNVLLRRDSAWTFAPVLGLVFSWVPLSVYT